MDRPMKNLMNIIRNIPDFPKKGVVFRDITPLLADPDALQDSIRRLARERRILRVKGHAAVAGKPMRLLVQAVGARVRLQYDRPWRPGEPRRSRLVVIGEHESIDGAAIRAALAG